MSSNAPVLFLIFNRPDTTQKVFDTIRLARPTLLFVAADGARTQKDGEAEKCLAARKIIEQVDWPCTVKTLYREENLGCKKAIGTAIDWFFSEVEEGIILEDDCLPDPSFFSYASFLLNRYKHDSAIKVISGTNYLFGKFDHLNGYYFSRFMPIWGWATWKRAWQEVDFNTTANSPVLEDTLKKNFRNKDFVNWIINMVKATLNGKIDAWSPYLINSFITKNGYGISPYRNLITNIGYLGHHTANVTANHPFFGMKTKSVDISSFPMKEDLEVIVDAKPEQLMMKTVIKYDGKKTITKRVLDRIKRRFT